VSDVKPLSPGDLIAVVAPAGRLPQRFLAQEGYVLEHLAALGYRVLNLIEGEGLTTPEQRADTITHALTHPEVKAVLPICGGKEIHETIRRMPAKIQGTHGKIFCGSSELSALNLKLIECSEVSCFYGPHLPFLHRKASFQERHFTVRSYWNMLTMDWHGKNGLDRHEMHSFFRFPKDGGPLVLKNIYRHSNLIRNPRCRDVQYLTRHSGLCLTGRIVPGSLVSLSEYLKYSDTALKEGDILLIDCLDQTHDHIMHEIRQMKNRGSLPTLGAIFFASCVERSDRAEKLFPKLSNTDSILNLLRDVERLFGDSVPSLYGFPTGHCAYKLTVPVGRKVKINTDSGEIEIAEELFKK
jgi:muramoyltetrapeptide carboxypeptidase LdcA involved in peptidoglycan recycling